MSNSEAPAAATMPRDIPVSVSATDEAAEVFLVDSSFRVLARGLGSACAAVPPGIYRAKARVGELQNEELFAVDAADTGRAIRVEAPEFPSPIPLAGTTTTHEYHQGAAQAAASQPGRGLKLGEGAKLALFLRDPSDMVRGLEGAALDAYAQNYRGVRLREWGGSETHVLLDAGVFEPRLGYLLLEAEVSPGAYVVSVPSPGRPDACMSLIASAGWATHLYLNLQEGPDPLARRIRLDDAAIVLDRPDAPFRPWRHDLRVLEVARQALASGHNVMAGPTMDDLLGGKFENPMMGLVAAHLLLLDPKPKLALVTTVIDNTAAMIGAAHPDLIALRLCTERLAQGGTLDAQRTRDLLRQVKVPPMLHLGWDYLMLAVAASSDAGVALRSPFTLATCVLSSAVWLTWENLPMPEPAAIPVKAIAPSMALPGEPPGLRRIQANSTGLDVVMNSALDTGARLQRLWNRVTRSSLLHKIMGPATPEPRELGLRGLALVTLEQLLRRHDWVAIVRHLKQGTGGVSQLTPLQRSLLIALKSAQEQWQEEGGRIPPVEAFSDWQRAAHLSFTSVAADVQALLRLAQSLDGQLQATPAAPGDTPES